MVRLRPLGGGDGVEAIDGPRQQIAVAEPFDRSGSGHTVVDDPAAGALGVVNVSHVGFSSFKRRHPGRTIHNGLDFRLDKA